MGLGLGVIMAVGMAVMTGRARPFFLGYLVVFALAVLSYFLAQQTGVKAWGFGYAIWALGLGLLVEVLLEGSAP